MSRVESFVPDWSGRPPVPVMSATDMYKPIDCRTPILRTGYHTFFKLENFNTGGSHKSRAARWMVQRAIETGTLVPHSGQTIIEKTGGNLGIGLAIEGHEHGFGVELAVGLSFSPLKRRMLDLYGAELIGIDMLQAGAQPVDVVNWHLEHAGQLGKSYYFIDQFNNDANVEAHYRETAPEAMAQLAAEADVRGRKVVLVGGVGSGASLSGIGKAFKETYRQVEVIGVQPAGCDIVREQFVDHNLQGIAVGVKPSIFDEQVVDRFISCAEDDAYAVRQAWARRYGIFPGNSSGANIWAVEQVASDRAYRDALIVSLIYDSGEAYVESN
jgi:cysteine synthase